MDRLKGKTALVVGGSSGIGREVCRLFAREGADVAVGDVGRDAEGQRLVEEIRGLGREALFIPVDVREEAMVEAAVAGAIARFGQLDILVNNAGIGGYHGPVQEATASD
ncbi:MAG: SDR family NAD(P)-dependent oxidoreductase [Gemmataceae bacterium]|nr:SDR family NAD(P)-dependent oxidoreductase [Gemmataceae bacterium]